MPFYPAAQAQNGWVPALLLWQKYKFVLRITLLTLETEDAVEGHWRREMKSAVVKRSIIINGHKTSVSLEDAFWKCLREIAVGRGSTMSNLVGSIDSERGQGNLSSAIRLFVLRHYQVRSNGRHEVGQAARQIIVSPQPAH